MRDALVLEIRILNGPSWVVGTELYVVIVLMDAEGQKYSLRSPTTAVLNKE